MEVVLVRDSIDDQPILDGVMCLMKDQICSMEMFLDLELLTEIQMASVIKNAFYQLGLVDQLQPFLDEYPHPSHFQIRILQNTLYGQHDTILESQKKLQSNECWDLLPEIVGTYYSNFM